MGRRGPRLPRPARRRSPLRLLELGQTITLTGIDPTTNAAVTVRKIVDPTTAADGISAPPDGHRYVAAEITLKHTGPAAYEETPDNCARIVDRSGRGFDPTTILSVAAGPVFPTTVSLQPGAESTGYVVFEIPSSSVVSFVQFALDSGVADDSGAWALTQP